jgi:hypothetical protein
MLFPPFGPYAGTPVFEVQLRSNAEGDLLHFKYYDASEDAVLDIVETYEFVINDILGDVIEPISFNIGSGGEECVDDDANVAAFGGCAGALASVGCDFNFPWGSDTYIYDFCPVSCDACPVACENDDEAVAAFGGCAGASVSVGCDFNFPWGSDTYIYDFCPIDCLEECASGDVEGCTDDSACNYNPDATIDDGGCLENDCAGQCGGSAEVDECGVCDGDGPEANYDCDGNCVAEIDVNGECCSLEDLDDCDICMAMDQLVLGKHVLKIV